MLRIMDLDRRFSSPMSPLIYKEKPNLEWCKGIRNLLETVEFGAVEGVACSGSFLSSPKSFNYFHVNLFLLCMTSSNPEIDCDFDCADYIADFGLGNSGSSSCSAIGISLFSLDNMANNDRTLTK
ncbi:hypothetical protein CR513_51150, partial [Mucuna pruriens]